MFYFARVTRIHPESHSCDVTLMATMRPLAGVHILSGMNGTDFGYNNRVDPAFQDLDIYKQKNTEVRDCYGIVVFLDDKTPVIIGFNYPEISQMLFDRHNFKIDRHGSDVYETINGEADAELYHPSGSYVRFAQTLDHEDLTHKDYDKLWEIDNNTDKVPGYKVIIKHRDKQGRTSVDGYIEIEPSTGYIKVWSKTEVDVTAPVIKLTGATQVEVTSADIDLDGPVDIEGNVTIHGDLTVVGDIHVVGIVYAADFISSS